MNVPKGYKMTEVGLIPEDWEVKKLGDIAEMASGGTPLTSNPNYYNGDIPWVSISDMTKGGKHIFATDKYITQLGFNNSACKIFPIGTVLYAMYASLGECSIAGIPLCSSQAILGIRVKENLDNEFLYYYLNYIKNTVKGYGQQGTQPNLNKEIVQNFQIKLPFIDEQRSIARVLSDTDELINALDKLIAKKRDIKKAVMQELLTGKTRLPGFSGEWEVKKLGDIAIFLKGRGLAKSELIPFGGEPCIHYGELFTQYPEKITEIISQTITSIPNACRSVSNDVLMPTSDVTPRGLAKASCLEIDGVILGGDILVIRSKQGTVDGTFLSYIIRYEENQVLQLVTGSTVYHLYASDMKEFIFSLPTLAEQQAIAQVLSDIDSEITALEKRRDKMKAIKQGMMQELLTGRIRLK